MIQQALDVDLVAKDLFVVTLFCFLLKHFKWDHCLRFVMFFYKLAKFHFPTK